MVVDIMFCVAKGETKTEETACPALLPLGGIGTSYGAGDWREGGGVSLEVSVGAKVSSHLNTSARSASWGAFRKPGETAICWLT